MALPTGQISMSDINTECLLSSTTANSLNNSQIRIIAGAPSSGTAINMNTLRGRQLAGRGWIGSSLFSTTSLTSPCCVRYMTGNTWLLCSSPGIGGAAVVAVSTDNGASRTQFTPVASFGVNGACYLAGRYIIAGGGVSITGRIASSTSPTSGYSIVYSASATSGQTFRVLGQNGSYAIAVCQSGSVTPTAMYSSNGTSWTSCGYTGGVTAPRNIRWQNGRWYLCKVGAMTYTSSSSFTSGWADATFSPSVSATAVCDIAYGNGVYVATIFNGTIQRSTDGVNFSGSGTSPPANFQPLSINFSNGIFVCGSNNLNGAGTIYVSRDGLSWTTALTPAQAFISAGYGDVNADQTQLMWGLGTGSCWRSNITNT